MPDAPDFAATITAAYAVEGPALDLGRGVLGEELHRDAVVQAPLAMLTRHGLIAGATGTGKTKTLQVLAEQIAALGVPVFAADIKGDLSGIATPGTESEKLLARTQGIGQDWRPRATQTEFYTLGGMGVGVPIRTTIARFGPVMLAKVLGLNETQESSLTLVFHYADAKALPLLETAAKGAPKIPSVLYHLGKAYHQAGRFADARQVLSQALELKADFPEMEDARKTLDALPAEKKK